MVRLLVGSLWVGAFVGALALFTSGIQVPTLFGLSSNSMLNLIAFGLLCGAQFLIEGVVRRMQRRAFGRLSFANKRMTAAVSSSALRFEWADGFTEVPWSSIDEIKATSDHLILIASPRIPYAVPRRAFELGEAFEVFAADARRCARL